MDRALVYLQQAADFKVTRSHAVRQVIEGLGLSVASSDEARDMLQLKGGDQVHF